MIIEALHNKVCQFATENGLFEPNDQVLVAVSGGPDSVFLALVLNNLKEKLIIDLSLFHYDHQIRKHSFKDTAFIADLAQKLGVRFYAARGDVNSYAKKNKKSLQQAARDMRYEALSITASKIKATKIATGHQANDQVETFLHRLLRGAALTGLSAIPVSRNNIIRPILSITKNEIMDYLKVTKQKFLTDPTNVKPIYFRNRIRHELMPVLERLNPDYLKVLLKNIKLVNEEDSLIDIIVKEISASLVRIENDVAFIRRMDFRGLSIAIKRRLIREAIKKIKGNLENIEYRHVNLVAINHARFGYTLELPDNMLAYNDYEDIKIGKSSSFQPIKFATAKLAPNKSIHIKQLGLTIETQVVSECESSNLVVCLDYDKIKPPLWVRTRKNGDRFRPLGAKGTKKLQDYFVDIKVPKLRRDCVLIVEDREKIIWVAGYQIDERVRIDTETKKILKICVR